MSMQTRMAARQRGVTLMELLTVVAVIGILSAIAIPTYTQYTLRVNRTDAKRDLLALAQRLERCFTRGNDYRIQAPGSAAVCVTLPSTNPEGTYTTTGQVNQTTFTLTATPLGGQLRDTRCGAFTLTNTGTQTVSGTMTAQNCWRGRGN